MYAIARINPLTKVGEFLTGIHFELAPPGPDYDGSVVEHYGAHWTEEACEADTMHESDASRLAEEIGECSVVRM